MMRNRYVMGIMVLLTATGLADRAFCQQDVAEALKLKVQQALGMTRDPNRTVPRRHALPVESVEMNGRKAVVTIGVPRSCPRKKQIIDEIKKRVSAVEGVDDVAIIVENKASCGVAESLCQDLPPVIKEVTVNPKQARPGEAMEVVVTIVNADAVTAVTADMGGIDTIDLHKMAVQREDTMLIGVWKGSWTVHGTRAKAYTTTVKATLKRGGTITANAKWRTLPRDDY